MDSAPLPPIDAGAFFAIDMRVGMVVDVREFPEARKPAFQVWVDFGPEIGIRKTSAQVTVWYTPEMLRGRRVVGWVNAPPKQIGPFLSEFLLLGAADPEGAIRLLDIENVSLGARIC
jgi:tRNA-binding protein